MSNFLSGRNFGSKIQTADLADNAITVAKMSDDSVTQAEIGDQAINEARMQISNAPTNGHFLSAQSGNTGGMTWAELSGFTFTEVAAQTFSGVGSRTFTIPSGAKRFCVQIHSVSNSGNSGNMGIQLGDSGGIETSGYLSTGTSLGGRQHSTSQFQLVYGIQFDHNTNFTGLLFFETLVGSSDLTWIGSGVAHGTVAANPRDHLFSGVKTISAELTSVKILTGGTGDDGTASIRWASA